MTQGFTTSADSSPDTEAGKGFTQKLFAASPRSGVAIPALLLLGLGLAGCNGPDGAGSADAQDGTPETGGQSPVEQVAQAVSDTQQNAIKSPTEQTYAQAWGPLTGSQSPRLAANDHTGQQQTLESLSGDRGLLLVFSRSADW